MNLSNKSILIVDRGLFTHLALFMARFYGKVYYHCITGDTYLEGKKAQIGKGLPGVEWVEQIWPVIDKVDVIFFPYTYDGLLQDWLRSKGYKVAGSGKAEIMELDKEYFHKVLTKVDLPQAKNFFATGIDAVETYLKNRAGTFYVKHAQRYRQDWETTKFDNPKDTEIFLNQARAELGPERSKSIKLLVQDKIESVCEAGLDAFMLNGEIAPNPVVGYEVKDMGYVGTVCKEIPKPIKAITDKLLPEYKRLGYQGPYSNELRITKDGTYHPIDETCRCPYPPTAVFTELYGVEYAIGIFMLAHGEMPTMKPVAKYGAEIICYSEWNKKHDLFIGAPKGSDEWLKLSNSVLREGSYYCIEHNNCGIFGSVVGIGNTLEEATEEATEMMKKLKVRDLKTKDGLFDECNEIIKQGEKYGIQF